MSIRNKLHAAFGALLSPLDSLYGFGLGFCRFVSAKTRGLSYFWGKINLDPHHLDNNRGPDDFERTQSGMTAGSRTLGTFGTIMVVLGFIGCTCIPLPGTGPLYAASVAGIFKAAGITVGWSSAARSIGSFFGSIIDYFKIKRATNILSSIAPQINTQRVSTGIIINGLGVAVAGEAAIANRPAKMLAEYRRRQKPVVGGVAYTPVIGTKTTQTKKHKVSNIFGTLTRAKSYAYHPVSTQSSSSHSPSRSGPGASANL
jgi:hypothetical protein